MAHPDWNDSYLAGDAPWDTGKPNPHLIEFVRSGTVARGRALEVGCGTGTNAVWMAKRGFDVTGVDLASVAIERAREKAARAKVRCRFERKDFLKERVPGGPFGFVFDLGCFHVFARPGDRARFAANVARALAPGGTWLSIIGSTEGPKRSWGPPRRSAREITDAIEPSLQILELRSVELGIRSLPQPVFAWVCVSARRAVSRRSR